MHRRVALCLFLSGAAGLIDQVVWNRGVAVLLGATATANALTLAVFLGGLALGAALFGRFADRDTSPLRTYAWLEIGIAITTVATPPLLRLATDWFVTLAAPLYPEHGAAVGAIKLLFAVAILLPPTLLMGGTLPLVVKALVRSGSEVGPRVALLYAANSAGGVLGALMSGLWLVPAIGLDKVATFAACLNLLAAAFALLPARSEVAAPAPVPEPARHSDSFDGPSRAVVLATTFAMAASGFSSLLYETLWIRLLSLVLGGTAHAFPLMVAAFIAGITAGAHWSGRRRRTWREALEVLVRAELAIALLVALAFGLYQRLPYVDLVVSSALALNDGGYVLHLVASFTMALAVMAVPAFAIGVTLPVAAQVVAGRVELLGRSFGSIYAWNTLGNVLGALAGGLLLMPLLGLKGAFLVGVVLNVASAIVPALVSGERVKRTVTWSVVSVLILVLVPYEPRLLSRGTFRLRGDDPGSRVAFEQGFLEMTKLLFHEDGASATVEVHEYTDDLRVLRINGKPDASTGRDVQTQLMASHLPMLVHPAPKDVLIVGLGSGMSVAAALAHGPDVRVTVLEISPEVVAANHAFDRWNGAVLADPRVKVVIDDARTYVRLTRDRFDVVVSEPSNPWMAGISGLFTDEFFRDAKRLLKPGATMVQWVQLYETSDEVVSSVVRTFRATFPDATGWTAGGSDLLLLSGVDPLQLDWAAVQKRTEQPDVAKSLALGQIRGAAAVAALHMASRDRLAEYAGTGPAHTDQKPVLEYAAARNLFFDGMAERMLEGDERLKPDAPLAMKAYRNRRALTGREAMDVAWALEAWSTYDHALERSARLRAWESGEIDPSEYGARRDVVGPLASVPDRFLEPDPTLSPEALYELGEWLLERERERSTVFRSPSREKVDRVVRLLLSQPGEQAALGARLEAAIR